MTKRYSLLIYAICTAFLLLYVMLCWHSRLATDDYAYIWQVYNKGVLNEVKVQYMLWSGRIAATFLTDVIYKVLDVDQTWYFSYPLFSGALLLTGVYKAINSVFSHYNFVISSAHKKLASLLFIALLFFMTIDIGETWFWYNSISHYLGSVIALIWGIAFLFDKRNQLATTIAAGFCFLYIGSASEVYAVIFGLFFLLLLYSRLKKHNYKIRGFFSDKSDQKIFFVALLFLISFIITVVAPGNYVRATFFPKPGFISTISLISYMSGKLFFWFIPQKLVYIIAFASPFLIIGKHYNKGINLSFRDFLKNVRVVTLLLFISCFVVFGLIAFIMSQSGEYRIWFILSFLLTVYCCGICFYAGYKSLLNDKYTEGLKKVSILIGLVVMGYTIINQYNITKKYSEAHDQRVAFLVKMNERIQKDTLITLPLLPPSGMLYSAEITNNPDDFLNEELKQGYRLKFHVVSEKKVP